MRAISALTLDAPLCPAVVDPSAVYPPCVVFERWMGAACNSVDFFQAGPRGQEGSQRRNLKPTVCSSAPDGERLDASGSRKSVNCRQDRARWLSETLSAHRISRYLLKPC